MAYLTDDCAPGKCPKTAEDSPIKCSSDLTMYFKNGYRTKCADGFECSVDGAAGDPHRLVKGQGGGGGV